MANTATPLALVPLPVSVEKRLEAALDRIVELEEAVGARTQFPARLKLSRCEAAILGMVLKRPVATYETLFTVLYGNDPDGGPMEPRNVVSVLMHNLRVKLKGPGIVILSQRSVGFYMTEEAKERLRKIIS